VPEGQVEAAWKTFKAASQRHFNQTERNVSGNPSPNGEIQYTFYVSDQTFIP
jgi:hypothetical protein